MISTPLVSVLIRSMARDELRDAINSVVAQTWPNIEVLVVNAAAGQHQKLQEIDNIQRIELINPVNALNRTEAANLLLSEARGEYLIFLDDDDWFSPNHIERLAIALQSDESCVLAYAGVDCLNEDGISLRVYDDPYSAARLRAENYIPMHAALFRKRLVSGSEQIQFDTQFDLFEDWDFWLQCQVHGRFHHVPGVSAFYRIHSGHGEGVSEINQDRSLSALRSIASKWQQRFTTDEFIEVLVLARHLKQAQDELTKTQLLLDEKNRTLLMVESNMHEILSNNQQFSIEIEKKEREVENLLRNIDEIKKVNKELADKNKMSEHTISDLEHCIAELDLKIVELNQRAVALELRANELINEKIQLEIVNSDLLDKISIISSENESNKFDVKKLNDHISSLDNYIHRIWSSKSWLMTKPVRQFGRSIRKGKSSIFGKLHQTGMCLYRSEITKPIMDVIPSDVKRKIHNYLLVGAAADISVYENNRGALEVVQITDESALVSIVIPVYNHAVFIKRCIESALSQTWTNTEVIVVNDASTDPRVSDILGQLEGHPRLKIIHNEKNVGICASQNNALIASKGKIIAFLDCDDFIAENAIQTCMDAWCDDTVYLHTGRINIDENDKEINRINFVSLPRENYFSENLQAMYATHLKLIRRDAFAKVGLFDERFNSAQDYEMLMRIAFHYPSSSFLHVPDFVYFHRLHAGQTTEIQRAKQDELTKTIQNEARLRVAIRGGEYKRFVSFIMLSYGKHSQTLRAIQGLQATVNIQHEIILYDNGSELETVDFIKNEIDGKFKNVKVIYGDRNLGPAQGRRAALEYAKGEWFIVFDNDEVPEPGWIEELLLRAEANENVGAVCCRVVFPDSTLQFSGGQVIHLDNDLIDLGLFDRGRRFDDLASCLFRQVDWCPIGATLFTRNVAKYLHDGYPNAFEDAGVSHALKKEGLQLLNAPGALVWHDHITFQPKAEMREQYMRDRYNPQLMLRSISSFYLENGKIIQDEYVWRENRLNDLTREELIKKLTDADTIERKF